MRDDEVYIPAEIPTARWRDQWAESVDQFPGGAFLAYPVLFVGLLSAIWDLFCILSWFFVQ